MSKKEKKSDEQSGKAKKLAKLKKAFKKLKLFKKELKAKEKELDGKLKNARCKNCKKDKGKDKLEIAKDSGLKEKKEKKEKKKDNKKTAKKSGEKKGEAKKGGQKKIKLKKGKDKNVKKQKKDKSKLKNESVQEDPLSLGPASEETEDIAEMPKVKTIKKQIPSSTDLLAKDAIARLRQLKTISEIDQFVKKDKRITVHKAAATMKSVLSK